MPRHLISDAHEWINEIPTVPIYYLAKPQPRERAWQNQRGKTLLSFFQIASAPILASGLSQNWRLPEKLTANFGARQFRRAKTGVWRRTSKIERQNWRYMIILLNIECQIWQYMILVRNMSYVGLKTVVIVLLFFMLFLNFIIIYTKSANS